MAQGVYQDSNVLVGERENKGELMTEEEKVIELIRSVAKSVVNWEFKTDWAKGYQEAMQDVLKRLPEEK